HLDAVPPHIAYRNPRLLGVFRRNPGQFAPPLLVKFRDRHSDDLAFGLRVETEAGFPDRLIDGFDDAAIPDLHGDHARLGDIDARYLVQRHHAAIGVDLDRLQQARRGPAGAQPAEFLAQYIDRAVHAAAKILQQFFLGHGVSPRVPRTLYRYSLIVAYCGSSMIV